MGPNNKKWITIGLIVVALVVGAISVKYFLDYEQKQRMQAILNTDNIYGGISIQNIDVSGLSKEEAIATLTDQLNPNINDLSVTAKYQDKSWALKFAEVDAQYNIEAAVTEAHALGRSGTNEERYNKVTELAKNGTNIDIILKYDDQKIISFLEDISKEINQEVKNSTISRANGKFNVTEAEDGQTLDSVKALSDIKAVMDKGTSGEVALEVEVVKPTVTKEDNDKVTSLLGSYSTGYSGSDSLGRNINLKVASDKINGTILAPGESFSMNDSLGPQTYAAGYREGGVIVNGKIEDGIGGGVCQVTTTLYNAVIFSELEIVERKNHSLAVGYVPLGRDAAIAGTYKDFKFKNSTNSPIFIEAYAAGGKVVANIYGEETRSASRTIDFERVYLGTIQKPAEKVTQDPTKPEGFREVTFTGKTGSKVSTYKLVYENGNLLSREWFSDSTYNATADEVIVGTGPKKEDTAVGTDTPPTGTIGTDTTGDPADVPASTTENQPIVEPPAQNTDTPTVEAPTEPVTPPVEQNNTTPPQDNTNPTPDEDTTVQ